MRSLQNRDMSHPLIAEILCRVHELKVHGFSLVFIRVPSHVRLADNLTADATAKATLNLPVTNLTISYSDYKSLDTKLHIKPVATIVELTDSEQVTCS